MAHRTTTITLTESADRKARLFKKASKMDLSTIVSEAIEEFIPRYLEENNGVRRKYEAEEEKFLSSAGVLVIPRKKRNISAPTTVSDSNAKGDLE